MTNWDEPDEDEEEELEELQPGDTDYDLTEQHPYSWEPKREGPPVPPIVAILVTLLIIAALVVPSIIIALQYD